MSTLAMEGKWYLITLVGQVEKIIILFNRCFYRDHTAQEKIRGASICVVGAGGLGCPAIQYLAGAGIGKQFIL